MIFVTISTSEIIQATLSFSASKKYTKKIINIKRVLKINEFDELWVPVNNIQ